MKPIEFLKMNGYNQYSYMTMDLVAELMEKYLFLKKLIENKCVEQFTDDDDLRYQLRHRVTYFEKTKTFWYEIYEIDTYLSVNSEKESLLSEDFDFDGLLKAFDENGVDYREY
jgi:hypothetical protein